MYVSVTGGDLQHEQLTRERWSDVANYRVVRLILSVFRTDDDVFTRRNEELNASMVIT